MYKKSVMSNFIWRFAERCGAQLVTFLVSVILARLLDPDVYGNVALVTVFIMILNVFVDSGMANALIQKKDADDLDFSSVFFFNIVACLILYLIMYLASPFIGAFYHDQELIPVVRVLSLTIVISGVKNIQQAYVSKTMQFKKFFYSTSIGTIAAAIIGIFMAYHGFGIWALVAQQLVNTLIDTIVLWFTVPWRPKLMFSYTRLRGLFSYGWKLLLSSLLDTAFNNIRQLIIGRLYHADSLAYFNRGKQFPNLFVTNINSSIDSVLLPTMSKEQDDIDRVKSMTRRAMKTSIYIMAPLMMGLFFCARPLVSMLLTDKWLPCVPFMRVFCITCIFYPIHTANLNAIKALGHSEIFLNLEIIKKIVGLIILLSTMWFGVFVMALSLLAESFIAQLINSWPNKKLLHYGYLEQITDVLPGILLSVAMGFAIWPVSFLALPDILILIIQLIAGVCFYIIGSAIFKIDSFFYLLDFVKPLFRKRRR